MSKNSWKSLQNSYIKIHREANIKKNSNPWDTAEFVDEIKYITKFLFC